MNDSNNSIPEITDTQKVLQLMKDQNKELKLNKKKLEKLEEKFIQVNSDLKNVLNDRNNIEIFLKKIFPENQHSNLIKKDYGTYESSELSKLWIIAESQHQNEYSSILSKLKNEINELNIKNSDLEKNLKIKSEEYSNFKNNYQDNSEKLNNYEIEIEDLKEKVLNMENEKNYLMKVLDEKNKEIEVLNNLELENAELKAKNLLDNFDSPTVSNINEKKFDFDNIKNNNNNENEKNINNNTNNNIINIKIDNLNNGTQTENIIFSKEEYESILSQLNEEKNKNEKLKKTYNDYKEKTHKIFLSNEANYNKILQEHENLKKELSQLLSKHKDDKVNSNYNNNNNKQNRPDIKAPSVGINLNFDVNKKVNREYLKNVLLKYLEAIAIGNEFETKILENVIFTCLEVSNNEKKYLEEKRNTSSFYYNLWYNAKAFLTSKIYGNDVQDEEEKIIDDPKIEEKKNNNDIINNK